MTFPTFPVSHHPPPLWLNLFGPPLQWWQCHCFTFCSFFIYYCWFDMPQKWRFLNMQPNVKSLTWIEPSLKDSSIRPKIVTFWRVLVKWRTSTFSNMNWKKSCPVFFYFVRCERWRRWVRWAARYALWVDNDQLNHVGYVPSSSFSWIYIIISSKQKAGVARNRNRDLLHAKLKRQTWTLTNLAHIKPNLSRFSPLWLIRVRFPHSQ